MPNKHKKVSAHLARIEGQLAAVRTALAANDCGKAARTLSAASRSLASARAECATTIMLDQVSATPKSRDQKLLKDIHTLIKG